MARNKLIYSVIVFSLASMFALSAVAGRILIEAENYTTCNEVGDEVIHKVILAGCSNGSVLVGLDYADEWTQYQLPLTEFGKFTVFIHCRGDSAVPFRFRLVLTGSESGNTQTRELSFAGLGFG